ncbi:MAG: hypothetical protein KC561_03810, partial [Myxococcales bacterium]|nr:hypothetical protein [Myxococcales bacterium]
VMVVAVVIGSLPMFAGAEIIKATTISGTMVLGLAPPILLYFLKPSGRFAFHLGFWPGVAVGVIYALGEVPESLAIGGGNYAALLGANVWGTVMVFGGFMLGTGLDILLGAKSKPGAAAAMALIAVLGVGFVAPETVRAQSAPPEEVEPIEGTEQSEQAEEVEDVLEATGPSFSLSGQTMLRTTFKFDDLRRPSIEVYNIRLVAQAQLDAVRFLTELRFRQSNLRSFSPSNVWIQQAYINWDTPVEGLSIAGGLLYNQLGLFWDGSWFGNLPYLNGHKLDPDLNLQIAYQRDFSDTFGLALWIQGSPGEDGLNGAYATANKLTVINPLLDPETTAGHREALSARARLVTSFHAGELTISPGLSVQHSVIDRTATDEIPEAEGTQTVVGSELSLDWRWLHVFGELLVESINDLYEVEIARSYGLGGVEFDLLDRETRFLSQIRIGSSFQYTLNDPEDIGEQFVTARIFARWHPIVGTTLEYVRWSIDGQPEPELERIEFIVHAYY